MQEALPDKAAPLVVACASGKRSGMASKVMAEKLGYIDITDMQGGWGAWTSAGL